MIILDVRERDEFEAEHIPESIFCPLSQFDLLAPGILKNLKNEEVTIMCRTGNRAKMAMNELKKHKVDHLSFAVFEGGIQKWKTEGKTLQGKGSSVPLMRQVQMIASTLIFLAFLGYHFFAPGFIYLALFVGLGLGLSGFIGVCPMISFLQKMPWNNKSRTSSSANQNSCCN
jgi:rhodanese-related sulfurtransferase